MTSEELRGCREGLGMTQAELARAVGVRSDTLSRLERGERKISKTLEILVRQYIVPQGKRAKREG